MEGGRHSFSHKRLSEGVRKEVIIPFLSLQSNSRRHWRTAHPCKVLSAVFWGGQMWTHMSGHLQRGQKAGRKAEGGAEMECVSLRQPTSMSSGLFLISQTSLGQLGYFCSAKWEQQQGAKAVSWGKNGKNQWETPLGLPSPRFLLLPSVCTWSYPVMGPIKRGLEK